MGRGGKCHLCDICDVLEICGGSIGVFEKSSWDHSESYWITPNYPESPPSHHRIILEITPELSKSLSDHPHFTHTLYLIEKRYAILGRLSENYSHVKLPILGKLCKSYRYIQIIEIFS